MHRQRKVGVIIVSYNSDHVLQSCLDALAASATNLRDGVQLEVVVVDNASTVRPSFAVPAGIKVDVVELDRNLGFSPAVNVGLSHLESADWVLLLNPDAQLHENALAKLIAEGERCKAALVGPVLVSPSGTPSGYSERPFHSLRHEIRHQLLPVRIKRRHIGSKALRTGDARCLTGACLLVEGDFIRSIGGLDTAIRMYLEDVELCWTAHEHGRPVRIANDAQCVHGLGGSSKGLNFRSGDRLHMTLLAARVEFVRRRSGRAAAAIMRSAIAVGALARVGVASALGRSPRRHLLVFSWATTSGRAPEWPDA